MHITSGTGVDKIGTQTIRRGNRLIIIRTRDGTTAVQPLVGVIMGSTLNTRPESESGTESHHVAVYVGDDRAAAMRGGR